MESESTNSTSQSESQSPAKVSDQKTPAKTTDVEPSKGEDIIPAPPMASTSSVSKNESPLSVLTPSGISSWARNLRLPEPVAPGESSQKASAGTSAFSRFTSGLGLRLPTSSSPPAPGDKIEENSIAAQGGVLLESLTKGLVDSSRSAVKAMQVKARHIVSQNKRRYQEGEFDLDMTYITENIIAMGFPAGDLSSGFLGFFEGFYRNHMEEVIKFFETHHKGKYKVYNLCSERLYDASLFQGKVASFPFDDHNCPPLHLITSFCQSTYSWLKEDIENVVVVHCKAGMARTGLMICSLLLFLKFFPTAEEAINYYNQKRCVDGRALVLPSQIRYVRYFERIQTDFNGENQPGRRCMLRGFRLHNCPYWIRPSITISNHSGILFSTRKHPKTKDLMPEDFWIKAPKKGMVVFALPGEPGLTELAGDFKIHFHDHQGDFYCWLNTTLTENRKILSSSDLDGFDKRKLPSPGFLAEIVMIDYDGTQPTKPKTVSANKETNSNSGSAQRGNAANSNQSKDDDVFSDSDGEEKSGASKSRQTQVAAGVGAAVPRPANEQIGNLSHETSKLTLKSEEATSNSASRQPNTNAAAKPAPAIEIPNLEATDIKAIAADASVFSFGDDEEFESD
ncbi:hypothetical protein SLE2022_362840 [Rubroshorea leprosula]